MADQEILNGYYHSHDYKGNNGRVLIRVEGSLKCIRTSVTVFMERRTTSICF
jgi:hypothetical protein